VLAGYFMTHSAEVAGLPPRQLGDDAIAVLQAYAWPGNIRQLRNVTDWLLIMAPGEAGSLIQADMLPPDIGAVAPSPARGDRDADPIIAVTFSDQVSMLACQAAHAPFHVPKKLARIRQQSYRTPTWAALFRRQHLPIDAITSPDIEVARAVIRRLEIPGAYDAIPLSDGLVTLVGVRCGPDCPIIATPLRHLTALFPDLHIAVVGIVRNDRKMVPSPDDQMQPGDEVYFVAETAHLTRALAAFGHEEPAARRLIIVGGGNIGLYLAQ